MSWGYDWARTGSESTSGLAIHCHCSPEQPGQLALLQTCTVRDKESTMLSEVMEDGNDLSCTMSSYQI